MVIDQSTGICTSPPSVTGYSRPHGISVSSYKFTWKSARCQDGSILQYQLQFTESCSTTLPVILITGSNKTSTIVVIPSCSAMDCYVRVRAELSDGSFTDYSTCVLINNQFVEYERKFLSVQFTVFLCICFGIVKSTTSFCPVNSTHTRHN